MNKTKILFIVIILLAAALRFYKLDAVPPSLTWDEAAVGYNAWTIANYGKDEYGNFFPAYFKSFGDDKHPVHIYATALSVKLLGLSEFSTRLPSAVFGISNVVLIFFLTRLMFSSAVLGLISSLFLAISPYNLHFSRFNHEANFALFFFMVGLYLFFQAVKNHNNLLPFSILSFGLAFLTYHPAKVLVPATVVILVFLYWRTILKNHKISLASLIVAMFLALHIYLNHQLLGIARVNQTSLGGKSVRQTYLYKLTKNELLGKINLIAIQYSWHFLPEYLFITGDKNPRLSSQTGEFYKLDAAFLILGILYLLRKRSKESIVLISWALLAPLPSALVSEAPHAARASFMMGSWHLISALGLYFLFNIMKKPYFKVVLLTAVSGLLAFFLSGYLKYYYGEYPKRYAIEWQYGLKEAVEYVKDNQSYPFVFMTNLRSQPYVFFLYHLKTSLPDYLNSVVYNKSESQSYNLVSSYDKYFFSGFDPRKDSPNEEALYILTPSEYDGLAYKASYNVKKVIYYPNGTVAYYIASPRI